MSVFYEVEELDESKLSKAPGDVIYPNCFDLSLDEIIRRIRSIPIGVDGKPISITECYKEVKELIKNRVGCKKNVK